MSLCFNGPGGRLWDHPPHPPSPRCPRACPLMAETPYVCRPGSPAVATWRSSISSRTSWPVGVSNYVQHFVLTSTHSLPQLSQGFDLSSSSVPAANDFCSQHMHTHTRTHKRKNTCLSPGGNRGQHDMFSRPAGICAFPATDESESKRASPSRTSS